MPIYKLVPMDHDDEDWTRSSHLDDCLVHAPSEDTARQYAHQQFNIAGGRRRDFSLTQSPWLNPDLVDIHEVSSTGPYFEGMVEVPMGDQWRSVNQDRPDDSDMAKLSVDSPPLAGTAPVKIREINDHTQAPVDDWDSSGDPFSDDYARSRTEDTAAREAHEEREVEQFVQRSVDRQLHVASDSIPHVERVVRPTNAQQVVARIRAEPTLYVAHMNGVIGLLDDILNGKLQLNGSNQHVLWGPNDDTQALDQQLGQIRDELRELRSVITLPQIDVQTATTRTRSARDQLQAFMDHVVDRAGDTVGVAMGGGLCGAFLILVYQLGILMGVDAATLDQFIELGRRLSL